MLARPPSPPLRPFVRLVWVAATPGGGAARERMLPSGATHVVLRLGGGPIRTFLAAGDAGGLTLGHAVVGGARAAPYVREVTPGAVSVGALLHPGAARALLGAPEGALAGRHTPLDALWSAAEVEGARERLASGGTPEAMLHAFEALLAARLPRVRGLHPAIAEALARFPGASVRTVVAGAGLSHRRFVALYREAVGLPPKLHCRVLRLGTALELLRRAPGAPLAELALRAGFADQAHLTREFTSLAGVSPGHYRRLSPAQPLHVPLAG